MTDYPINGHAKRSRDTRPLVTFPANTFRLLSGPPIPPGEVALQIEGDSAVLIVPMSTDAARSLGHQLAAPSILPAA